MVKSNYGCPRKAWCAVNMFHINGMIINNGTICYSVLYFSSPVLCIRMKYMQSVISVIVYWLPGNTKEWTIDKFVAFGVRFFHSWADPQEGTGTRPDYFANRADQKNEGHEGKKKAEKWHSVGSGSTRTVDAEPKCALSWNQIQTLKDCLCYHIYCVQRYVKIQKLEDGWQSDKLLGWRG